MNCGTKTTRALTECYIIISALVVAVAVLCGILLTQHDAPASSANTSVSSFNDGFATGKQDDCQQGYAAACAWLRSN